MREAQDTKMIVVSKESVIVNVRVLRGREGSVHFTLSRNLRSARGRQCWKILNSHILLSVAPGDWERALSYAPSS